MSATEEDLVVRLDPDDEVEAATHRLGDEDDFEWARSVAMGLILAGSLLGLWFGILLFAADPQDVLDSDLFGREDKAMVTGQILTELDEGNLTGGDPVEGVHIRLLDLDGTNSSHEAFTNRDGRFRMFEVPQQSWIVLIEHPGNQSLRITFNPGDQSDLMLTLTEGEGTVEEDWRYESHLEEAVFLASVIALVTIGAALLGLVGAAEVKRGQCYRRTQYLCGLALFSRGGIFIGPMLILAGMGMLAATKRQFADVTDDDD
jgi:hypothetical protein